MDGALRRVTRESRLPITRHVACCDALVSACGCDAESVLSWQRPTVLFVVEPKFEQRQHALERTRRIADMEQGAIIQVGN